MTDLTIETERGVVVDSLDIWIRDVMRIIDDAVPADELNATHCLQYIDPYGDTLFNMLQKKRLFLELMELSNKVLEGAEAENLARVIEIVNRYQDEVHLYVKFHGD